MNNDTNNRIFGAVPPDIATNVKLPTDKEMAAMNLRMLMTRTEGQDKCTICNAVRQLEKNEHPQNSAWPFIPLFMMLFACGNNGSNSMFNDEAFLKAFSEALEKTNKENSENTEEKENTK